MKKSALLVVGLLMCSLWAWPAQKTNHGRMDQRLQMWGEGR